MANRGNTRRRSGAAAVEMAILLPLLIFICLAVVDFARVFYFSMTLWNCARQGALYGSDPVAAAQSPYTSISQAALADATSLSPQPKVTSTTGIDSAGNPYVVVTVNWTFSTITSYPLIGGSFKLDPSVQMRIAPTLPQ